MVGEKVIAKRTTLILGEFGFYKGDTLLIVDHGTFVDYLAKNLTRPRLNNDAGYVPLFAGEFKSVKKPKPSPKQRIYFLGIPLFTVRDVNNGS